MLLTPWYDEAEAQAREQRTEAVVERSARARARADRMVRVVRSYQAADYHVGRTFGGPRC